MARVGEILYLGGVEEDSEVGILMMGVVSASVVGVINELDLLHVFYLGFIEVGTGGINNEAESAGLGNRLRDQTELLYCLESILSTNCHSNQYK